MYSLRPALMAVPEGDWFCPACNHKKLLSSLTDKLTELDSLLKKTEAERRRKERLAFINKGLSKTLPTAQKKESSQKEANYSSDDESSSDTDSEDEVLLPRKCRTKNPVKYNTEEYDQLMNNALGKDVKYQMKDAPAPAISDESEEEEESENEDEKASPGKPRSGQGKGKNIDNCSDESEEESEDNRKKPKPIKMNINKMKGGKKKRKKLTNLNASDESDDGDSGSDFKLSDEVSEEEEFIDDGSNSDSDVPLSKRGKKGRGGGAPSRRSTRARRSRLDDDFVVDGSDSEDYAPKKKRSKWASESEESER